MVKSIKPAYELTELLWYRCFRRKFAVDFEIFEEVVIKTRLLQRISLTLLNFVVQTPQIFSTFRWIVFGSYRVSRDRYCNYHHWFDRRLREEDQKTRHCQAQFDFCEFGQQVLFDRSHTAIAMDSKGILCEMNPTPRYSILTRAYWVGHCEVARVAMHVGKVDFVAGRSSSPWQPLC